MMGETWLAQYANGIQLRGDVLVLETASAISFARGGKSLSIKTQVTEERNALKHLREGIAPADLAQLTSTPRILKMFRLLNSQKHLKPLVPQEKVAAALSRQVDWLSHFSDSPLEKQNQLAKKSVMILGCGGTGSIIAEHLVRAGVNRLVLVDGGIVDMPDMNRQLAYTPEQCGQKKVDALSERLQKLNPDLQVKTLSRFVESQHDIESLMRAENPDLVINGADTPIALIHCWVADACEALNTPVLFGGVGLEEGTLGPFLFSSEARAKYSRDMRKAEVLLKDNTNILKASVSFTNSFIAVLMAHEAFKYLSDAGSLLTKDKALAIDFFSLGQEVQWTL